MAWPQDNEPRAKPQRLQPMEPERPAFNRGCLYALGGCVAVWAAAMAIAGLWP